jgi:hypothetical protein
VLKFGQEVAEILEAYDVIGSYRAAGGGRRAELAVSVIVILRGTGGTSLTGPMLAVRNECGSIAMSSRSTLPESKCLLASRGRGLGLVDTWPRLPWVIHLKNAWPAFVGLAAIAPVWRRRGETP